MSSAVCAFAAKPNDTAVNSKKKNFVIFITFGFSVFKFSLQLDTGVFINVTE
jgi:hypothetical protein